VKAFVKTTGPQLFRSNNQRALHPIFQRRSRAFRYFETDERLRFALQHLCTLLDLAGRHNIDHFHLNKIAAAQLAVDGQIEQRRVAMALGKSSRTLIAQTCLGFSGRFWPAMCPLLQAGRGAGLAGKKGISMTDPPIRHAPPTTPTRR